MAKVSSKSLWLWVALAALFLSSVYSAGMDANCTQICDKYRTVDSAFTLNCDDHPSDEDCKSKCKLCARICTNHSAKKVYNCPQGEVSRAGSTDGENTRSSSSSSGDSSSSNNFLTIYFILAGIVVFLILCCSLFLAYKRIQNGTCCDPRTWQQPGFLW